MVGIFVQLRGRSCIQSCQHKPRTLAQLSLLKLGRDVCCNTGRVTSPPGHPHRPFQGTQSNLEGTPVNWLRDAKKVKLILAPPESDSEDTPPHQGTSSSLFGHTYPSATRMQLGWKLSPSLKEVTPKDEKSPARSCENSFLLPRFQWLSTAPFLAICNDQHVRFFSQEIFTK